MISSILENTFVNFLNADLGFETARALERLELKGIDAFLLKSSGVLNKVLDQKTICE